VSCAARSPCARRRSRDPRSRSLDGLHPSSDPATERSRAGRAGDRGRGYEARTAPGTRMSVLRSPKVGGEAGNGTTSETRCEGYAVMACAASPARGTCHSARPLEAPSPSNRRPGTLVARSCRSRWHSDLLTRTTRRWRAASTLLGVGSAPSDLPFAGAEMRSLFELVNHADRGARRQRMWVMRGVPRAGWPRARGPDSSETRQHRGRRMSIRTAFHTVCDLPGVLDADMDGVSVRATGLEATSIAPWQRPWVSRTHRTGDCGGGARRACRTRWARAQVQVPLTNPGAGDWRHACGATVSARRAKAGHSDRHGLAGSAFLKARSWRAPVAPWSSRTQTTGEFAAARCEG
jgi:hypothetical protein